MLRIGALRGSGRKRTAGNSPRCARLRHPAVFFFFGLHCSALRPRGAIQAKTGSLRFAKIAKRSSSDNAEGEFDRNSAKHRNFGVAAVPTLLLGRPRCIRVPSGATRSAGPKGVRRMRRCGQLSEDRQSDPSSGRIPSDRASQCTGASRRRATRVSFSFAYFLLDKQKKVSRTAVRNKRSNELLSAVRLFARSRQIWSKNQIG